MNKTNIKLVKKTLKHWDKMIRWAGKQQPRNRPDEYVMADEIGENWNGGSWPLCLNYSNVCCVGCPIFSNFGQCSWSGEINTNLWQTLSSVKTWGTWVKKAKLFRKQIASLLK